MFKYCANITLFSFILAQSALCRDGFSMWPYGGMIFVLDGFSKSLEVYSSGLVLEKRSDLRKVSPSGMFAFFSVYDPYRYYVSDPVNGIIRQLDEDMNEKDRYDLKKNGPGISGPVFPYDYNSVIVPSKRMDTVYLIRNGTVSEIISADEVFKDIWVDGRDIYLLYDTSIRVFTSQGVLINETAADEEYSMVRAFESIVGVYDGNRIISFGAAGDHRTIHDTGAISDFCILNGSIYFMKEGSKELLRTGRQ